jgi:hypothetical protein
MTAVGLNAPSAPKEGGAAAAAAAAAAGGGGLKGVDPAQDAPGASAEGW